MAEYFLGVVTKDGITREQTVIDGNEYEPGVYEFLHWLRSISPRPQLGELIKIVRVS